MKKSEIQDELNIKLYKAVQAHDPKLTRKIISDGADVSCRIEGKSLLEFLPYNSRDVSTEALETLKVLLGAGLSPETQCSRGGSIFFYSYPEDNSEFVKSFILAGKDVRSFYDFEGNYKNPMMPIINSGRRFEDKQKSNLEYCDQVFRSYTNKMRMTVLEINQMFESKELLEEPLQNKYLKYCVFFHKHRKNIEHIVFKKGANMQIVAWKIGDYADGTDTIDNIVSMFMNFHTTKPLWRQKFDATTVSNYCLDYFPSIHGICKSWQVFPSQLPGEMWREVFSYLSLSDIIHHSVSGDQATLQGDGATMSEVDNSDSIL